MRKYLIFFLAILFIIYYIFTFLISFTFLSRSVANNDPTSLQNYINTKKLKHYYYNDVLKFSSNFVNSMDKNIKIKNESIELTGELTSSFLKKLFSNITNNIASDFSNPEIMLYFYFNSNEISTYLNKSFAHLGDYNFNKYLAQKEIENVANNEINENEKETTNNIESVKKDDEEEDIDIKKDKNNISELIQRIQSTDYFFLITPIHFKISVKHQDIKFIVILKFNGFTWKVERLIIPYQDLIEFKNISLIN